MSEDKVMKALAVVAECLEKAAVEIRQIYAFEKPGELKWEQREGGKGPYERADVQDMPEYRALKEEISEHGGFLKKDGWQYWLFDQTDAIGRRRL